MGHDLRACVLEALNTAQAGFIRDDPESAASHRSGPWWRHDQHQYDGGCALCRGEAETIADAVLAALGEVAAPPMRPASKSWEIEDERYEVLVSDTVYGECDALGGVAHIVAKARAEIDAYELEGEVRTRCIVRYLRAEDGDR